tara:strand:+ start:1228 stop:1500 length:273 start_codon:yes stop_codon:yes gene_type:complete
MEAKQPVNVRVKEKYQAMLTYYAELMGLCHETVAKTNSLQGLDPMGKKTTATSLFIRVCARMDKSMEAEKLAEKLTDISNKTEERKAVNE